jgi:hypothetical protein
LKFSFHLDCPDPRKVPQTLGRSDVNGIKLLFSLRVGPKYARVFLVRPAKCLMAMPGVYLQKQALHKRYSIFASACLSNKYWTTLKKTLLEQIL